MPKKKPLPDHGRDHFGNRQEHFTKEEAEQLAQQHGDESPNARRVDSNRLDTQIIECRTRIEQARYVGNLRDVREFEYALGILEAQRERQIERMVDEARNIASAELKNRQLRKLARLGFAEYYRRQAEQMGKFFRDLKDLQGIKPMPIGTVTDAQRHSAVIKHLRRKWAGRIAREGGLARGRQKSTEGASTREAVHRLLTDGLNDAEIAEKLSITRRRVRQVKAGN